MLALLNTLLYEDGYRYANFASTILMLVISIVVIIAGSFMFFIEPTTPVEEEKHDSNLAPFIVIITIIIILLELLIVIGSAFDGNYMNFFLFISGTIQKAVQLFIYHCRLCEFIPKRGRLYGASWYYKTIALINFILWVESIEVTKDRQTIYMEKILKGGYSIFAKAYTALIVDYRLICCILFVEHAFEIDKTIKSDETEKENQLRQDATTQRKPETDEIHHSSFEEYQKFKSKVKLYKGAGVISGLGIVFLQTFNAMVYTGNNMVGPWTNVMGCVAVWSFFLAGILLLNKLKEEKQGENHTGQNDKDDVITFPPLEGTNEFEESLIIETSPAQNTTHQTIPGSHIKNEDTATKSCNLYTENFHDSIGITTSQRKVKCTPRRSRQDIHQLFDCEFCGAQFVHKTHLRIHTRSHTGEKPHKCTFCGRGFAQKGNLRVHEKIHTGEKEYACQFCNKRFITNAQLLVHIRTHTNPNKKRPFSVGGGGYKDADTRDKVIKQGPGNSSNKDSAAILTGSNKNAILNSEFTSKDSITDSMNKLLGQLVSNGQNNKRTLNEPESISSVFVDRIARSKITTSVNSEPHMTVISQIGSNSPVVIERTNEIF
ncbi:uncharacterized protein [Clytia hemisphaerica]